MIRRIITGIVAAVMAMTPLVALPAISNASSGTCGAKVGATEIFEGMATDDKDITIYNDKMAVSFAVGSNNYWNMTKGSILDIAAIDSDGKWGSDLVNDVELLMDLWTSTGEYKGTDLRNDVEVTYDLADDKSSVSVTSKYRYWVADPNKDGQDEDAKPLEVTQVYTLKSGDNHLQMETEVTNPNDDIDYGNDSNLATKGMYTGYSISTNAANMFGPFGYYPDTKATGIAVGSNEQVNEYFGKFVTTYKDDYAVTLIMDDTDSYKGSSGYKDIYKNQVLKAGETYTFSGEVLVETANSTASVLDRIYSRDNISDSDVAEVSGKVTDENGDPVEGVNVIVKKDGSYLCTDRSGSMNGKTVGEVATTEQPFVWAVTDSEGNYSFKLPKTSNSFDEDGNYKYKLKLEAAGYTSQTTDEFQLSEDKTQDFTIKKGANIKLTAVDQDGEAIPFRVEVSGVTYDNKCAGISTYFSDYTNKEKSIEFNLTQADDVTFTASYGKNFESKTVSYKTNITSDGVTYEFKIKEDVDPEESGWVSMDNHQHSNYGDGATTPKDLFNAQVAAKLHYNLVADHDTRINNIPMKKFADSVDRPYLSNMEISPGWGHWGVLNVDFSESDYEAIVNASTATPSEIIKTGHEKNALVIVHHPYSDYGYLNNQASVSGGYADGWDNFDLLELQSTISTDGKTLEPLEGLTADNYKSISFDNLTGTIGKLGVSQMDAKALVTAFAFWNKGEKKYLSAGSDQHQATNTALYPGIIRMYAKVGTKASDTNNADGQAYLKALKNGNAYMSMGPLFFTYDGQSFGDTISKDKDTLKIDAQAVNGLDKVVLYSNGVKVDSKTFDGATDKQTIEFDINSKDDTKWYSFVSIDSNGNYAVSNPIWVSADKEAGGETTEATEATDETDATDATEATDSDNNDKDSDNDSDSEEATSKGGVTKGDYEKHNSDKSDKTAKTGDYMRIGLLIAIMAAAAIGAVIIIVRGRRENK